jgi:hypothetical protein
MRAGVNEPAIRAELELPGGAEVGSYGFFTRVHARLRASALDRALAVGADPHASPALGCRAQQLTGGLKRKRLADAVRRLRADARRPMSRGWSSALPINRGELLAADPLLAEIEAQLREGVVYCQGVVRLDLLLADGGSSVYAGHGPSRLVAELEAVLDGLEGRG